MSRNPATTGTLTTVEAAMIWFQYTSVCRFAGPGARPVTGPARPGLGYAPGGRELAAGG